jgi:hypothetical protein
VTVVGAIQDAPARFICSGRIGFLANEDWTFVRLRSLHAAVPAALVTGNSALICPVPELPKYGVMISTPAS